MIESHANRHVKQLKPVDEVEMKPDPVANKSVKNEPAYFSYDLDEVATENLTWITNVF